MGCLDFSGREPHHDHQGNPDGLRESLWGRGKTTLCAYGELIQDSRACVLPQHKEKIPRDVRPSAFILCWTPGLPKGRGRSTALVLEGIYDQLGIFYKRVAEQLERVQRPSKMKTEEKPEAAGQEMSDPEEGTSPEVRQGAGSPPAVGFVEAGGDVAQEPAR